MDKEEMIFLDVKSREIFYTDKESFDKFFGTGAYLRPSHYPNGDGIFISKYELEKDFLEITALNTKNLLKVL